MNTDVQARQNRAVLMGAIVVLLVGSYWAFIALDSWGLPEQQSSAVVLSKRYEAAHSTYTTQVINGQTRTLPRQTAEAYLLQLEIAGEQADASVPKDFYESVAESETVRATFKRGRITGGVEIVNVSSQE